MGTSTSKAAKSATQLSAANTARKYPTRSPPLSSPQTKAQPEAPSTTIGPSIHPPTHATEARDRGVCPSVRFQSRAGYSHPHLSVTCPAFSTPLSQQKSTRWTIC
ncbi:uncharacterized protein K444DRAFT_620193 [Hyaloscypha bicolor E]|uniref:Uncharacterized protein n=1 Tax=Hyaloscypha bicolor E TaxID=1095630 RepID=A0A2J6SJQ4_9HELO|nr:uncharacterized protein K444DRAFT_620193 [Hyaloscypha bicolor E]PMD51011.1 hypothetical protein K444DRAFT_620193 [Hyaloscypha bicolor E]